jgi:predicted RNA-binding protein with TRAM domain
MNEQEAPVKEGETYDVEILSVGEKGDGIAKVSGFVLFVPDTKKRDYVKIKITKVLKNVGFAKVLEKIEKPVRKSKFAMVTEEEIEAIAEPDSNYEDTDDFGEEFVEE